MKRGIFLICILLFSGSCSQYQKVYKSDSVAEKYALGEKLYDEGRETESDAKLKKALNLFEQIIPEYRGKPQAEKLMFMYANTYFLLEDYLISSYQFERFAQLYSRSSKVEEALFKSAKSHYMESPRYTLDQSETIKAIEKLQEYINTYPEGEYLDEANKLIAELRVKLDRKAYEIAKQYHHRSDYKAAIEAFDNFILDHPGSPFREKAYFYKFDSAYRLAVNSVESKIMERLATAEEFYNTYKKYYPQGEFIPEAEAALEHIQQEQATRTL